MNNLTSNNHLYCSYYQAYVLRSECWFVVAVLKSFEHMSFDRTLDTETSLFEFYVPPTTERYFLELMEYFIDNGFVTDLRKLPNRLSDPSQKL